MLKKKKKKEEEDKFDFFNMFYQKPKMTPRLKVSALTVLERVEWPH